MDHKPLSKTSKTDYVVDGVSGKSDQLGAEALNKMPREGFLKVTRPEKASLTSEQRVLLVRQGNALFAEGKIEQAKKIFVSTGYSDGMIRVGDFLAQQRDYLAAYQMYKMAPAPDKAQIMTEKLTTILRNWLKE